MPASELLRLLRHFLHILMITGNTLHSLGIGHIIRPMLPSNGSHMLSDQCAAIQLSDLLQLSMYLMLTAEL